MKLRTLGAVVATTILLTGCVSMRENPKFNACADSCSNKQNSCMVNASSANDVEKCGKALDSCVAACEKRFPRYLQPK